MVGHDLGVGVDYLPQRQPDRDAGNCRLRCGQRQKALRFSALRLARCIIAAPLQPPRTVAHGFSDLSG
jgi:hypothetical protein